MYGRIEVESYIVASITALAANRGIGVSDESAFHFVAGAAHL